MRRPLPPDDSLGLDAAWRIHQAQMDWTGRVDAKASFAFALESAAVATTVALSAKDRIYAVLTGFWPNATYWVGFGLLLASALLAVSVVAPRLRSHGVGKTAKDNYIYFGHARRWEAKDLERQLRHGDLLPNLSRQIIVMADIAWRKHRRTQWSLWVAIVGAASLLVCAYLAGRPVN